jgi:hypothetical protein
MVELSAVGGSGLERRQNFLSFGRQHELVHGGSDISAPFVPAVALAVALHDQAAIDLSSYSLKP